MNHVPLGTPRPLRLGPKPPARTTAAATLLFLFFQSVEDILFLAKTKMHRIRMHPLPLLFSRGLSQSRLDNKAPLRRIGPKPRSACLRDTLPIASPRASWSKECSSVISC